MTTKISSEYDQEIKQSQTADKLVVSTTIMRHKEDKQSKAISSLFPIEMIAKLKWTQSTTQQNIDKLLLAPEIVKILIIYTPCRGCD